MKKINVRISINGETDCLDEILNQLRLQAPSIIAMGHFGKSLRANGKYVAHASIQHYPMPRDIDNIEASEIENDMSGTVCYNDLERQGWEAKPVVTMFGRKYILLHQPDLSEGAQRAEVFDIEEFDDKNFKIAVSYRDYAYVQYYDEGWSVLVVRQSTGKLTDYNHPYSSVLTYRINKPTREDVQNTADQLMDELENSIDNGGLLFR